ncbi:MAG: AMP-binding protein [bacterium]|nr:AMP-binding protein [bacterium]
MAEAQESPDFLTALASATPRKGAIIDDRPDGSVREISFAGLEARSNRIARALLAAGVRPHDRVAWCGPNSIDALVIIHAARKICVTPVAVNYRLTDEEAAFVLMDSDSVIAWIDAEYAQRFSAIAAGAPSLREIVVFDGPAAPGQRTAERFLAGRDESPPDLDTRGEKPVTMHYTSGTTGRPKGAVRGATGGRDQGEELPNMLDLIGYGPGDVYITTGPLYHSGPGEMATLSTMFGNTIIVQRRFDAEDWLRLVERYAVTIVYSAPTPIRRVVALPAEVKARYDRSSVKIGLAAAAPWTHALKLAYLDDFPEDSLWEIYGSTELGANTLLRPEDQRRKPGSCGQPIPGIEIALFAEDGHRISEPNTPGELFVRSPLLFDAYHKNESEFAQSERDGFHSVGDVAYVDDEGFYYICDRKSDMIISGGVNIYALEVESALEFHEGVAEAAVIGIPSDEWGEAVHAIIVPRPAWSADAEELEVFVRERLAGFKVPRSIEFRERLPHNGAGKILKRELRESFWEGRARRLV